MKKAWEVIKTTIENLRMVRSGKLPDPEQIPESPIQQIPITMTLTLPSGEQITKEYYAVRPYCPVCLEPIPKPEVRDPEAKKLLDLVDPWCYEVDDDDIILKERIEIPLKEVSGIPHKILKKYGEIKKDSYTLTSYLSLHNDGSFPFLERFKCECGTEYTFLVDEEEMIEIFPHDILMNTRLWATYPIDLENWIMFTGELYHVAPDDNLIAFHYTGSQQLRIYGIDGKLLRSKGLRSQEVFEKFLDRSLSQILDDPKVPPIHSNKNISVRIKTLEHAHKVYMIRKISGERSLGKLFRGYLRSQYPELLRGI